DHLAEQLALTVTNPARRMIGQYLIDLVDEAGYLNGDVALVAEKLGAPVGEVEAVLAILQGLDPPGVCARSLTECLAIQLKALDQRAKTILKVSTEIVRQQDAFFLHGVQHLRPLNLKTIADAIAMHESTVSRVTANKYMATNRGIFELKYFFTSAIASADGGE